MKNINRGFSLIELMLVLAIAGILLMVGIPSFQEMIKNNRMTASANELVGAFGYARMEAAKRGSSVYIGQRVANSWADGLVVWVDSDGGADWDSGEELRLWEPLNGASTLVIGSADTQFVFSATGGSDTGNTFTLCDDRTAEVGRTITLLVSGLVKIKINTCS